MKMRTRAKVCGLTREADIRAAVNAGFDAIGLVFYPPSPRAVDVAHAAALCVTIPAYVQTVGLFVNATQQQIEHAVQQVHLDMLQFHGDESAEHCQMIAKSCARRWYKAIQVKPNMDLTAVVTEVQRFRDAGASAILLDAWHPELKGGTGHRFDWAQFPQLDVPLILAGGLNPDNVAEAIHITHAYAVDVSGGVEAAKGIKDPELMQRFMQGVQCGSAQR